jgi:glycerol-3-phosphate acyltransferase PlsY
LLGPSIYLLLTYLVASIPTGPVLATLYAATDITQHGSGNIGATNVNRLLGRRFAVATLLGDFTKGLIPVLLAPLVVDASWYTGIVALVAFCGHCWSAYLSFRGGKGVATAAGAMAALAPLPTLLTAAAWMSVVLVTKRASVAALVGALALPGFVAVIDPAWLWVCLPMAVGVLFRHRSNIQRLATGQK